MLKNGYTQEEIVFRTKDTISDLDTEEFTSDMKL